MLARREDNNGTEMLWFKVPTDSKNKAVEAIRSIGGVLVDPLPAFGDCKDADDGSPAIALRALRRREELTQKELAKKTGISQADLSKMETGKLAIGKERAKTLADVLHTSYKVFL